MKFLFVCSSGGHLLQLFQLSDLVPKNSQHWVTFHTADALSLLRGRKTTFAFYPTNRSLVNLLRNIWLANKILYSEKPTHVVSTGAGIAVPFFLLARLYNIKTCFIESLARVSTPSLSGKICYRLATVFIYQWKELSSIYPKGVFGGPIY
jgi:beta-1,4-N-acetylglucosaminyltransferase